MRDFNIFICVGLGVIIGLFMLIDPLWFFLISALFIIIVIIIVSPYFGIIMLIILSPFQAYIREFIGDSIIRFWREGLLIVIFCATLAKILWNKEQHHFLLHLKRTRQVLIAVIVFISYMVIRSAMGPHKLEVLSGLAENCLYSLFFVACLLTLRNNNKIFGIFIAISIVALLMSLGCIWESILGGKYIISTQNTIDIITFPRSSSFMEGPLELGNYLAISFPLILSLIQETRIMLIRTLLIFTLLIVIVGLATTGSRGPWVQFFVSIIIYVAINPNRSIAQRLKSTFATSCIVIFMSIIVSVVFPYIGERVISIFDWRKDEGNIVRIYRWEKSINKIYENPVIGKGLGAESLIRGKSNIDKEEEKNKALVQESLILKIWLQTGIIGVLCFLYLYISAMGCAYFSRNLPEIRSKYIGVAITSVFFGQIIEILHTQTLHSWAINIIFWCFIAIPIVLKSNRLKEVLIPI